MKKIQDIIRLSLMGAIVDKSKQKAIDAALRNSSVIPTLVNPNGFQMIHV